MGYGKTQKDGFRTSGKGLVSPLSLSLSLSLSSFEIIQRVVLLIPSPIKELSTVCIMLRHSGFMILRFGTSLDVEHTKWTIKVDDGVTVVVFRCNRSSQSSSLSSSLSLLLSMFGR